MDYKIIDLEIAAIIKDYFYNSIFVAVILMIYFLVIFSYVIFVYMIISHKSKSKM